MDYLQLNQYKKVKTFFDKDSSRYLEERYNQDGFDCGTMAYISRRNIVLKMIDSACGLWLDAGCGPGPLIPDLLEKGLRVVGTDFSLEMIRAASERITEQEQDKVFLSVNNVDSLSFGDHSFDGVTLIGVLSYVPDIRSTLQEIHRVLKPGGVGIFQISNRLSLPEAEIRFLLPLWNYIERKRLAPKGQKVHFSWNPYDQAHIQLRAFSPRELNRICQSLGLQKVASEYFDFRIPIVWKLLPKPSVKISSFLSRTNHARYFSFLASGYMLKVKKKNGL